MSRIIKDCISASKAFFYSSNIEMAYLLYAFFTFITLIIVNLSGNHNKLIYFILGILLWYFFLKSGIHATIAGVLLAATIPNVMNSNWKSMLKELEHSLHNFVGLFILPVFAFCFALLGAGKGSRNDPDASSFDLP